MMHEALREADWQRLEELRAQFLAAQEGDASAQPSAWKNERDLLLYDAVYGARIGWKWDAFLRDALPRLVLPANARLLDLGCGTGVATRAFARHAAGIAASVQLVDHSLVATQVANSLVERDVPGLARTATPCDLQSLVAQPFDVLLVSHVIDEWKDEAWHAALRLARQASIVLWLEGGARAMQRVREDLLTDFEPLLPCTHNASCGALQEINTHEWCHRFAQPPQEAFTTAHFSFAAKRLGLDLRSLPYCGLAMAKPGFHHAAHARPGASARTRQKRERQGDRLHLRCAWRAPRADSGALRQVDGARPRRCTLGGRPPQARFRGRARSRQGSFDRSGVAGA